MRSLAFTLSSPRPAKLPLSVRESPRIWSVFSCSTEAGSKPLVSNIAGTSAKPGRSRCLSGTDQNHTFMKARPLSVHHRPAVMNSNTFCRPQSHDQSRVGRLANGDKRGIAGHGPGAAPVAPWWTGRLRALRLQDKPPSCSGPAAQRSAVASVPRLRIEGAAGRSRVHGSPQPPQRSARRRTVTSSFPNVSVADRR